MVWFLIFISLTDVVFTTFCDIDYASPILNADSAVHIDDIYDESSEFETNNRISRDPHKNSYPLQSSKRIIGGEPATTGQIPYIVSMRKNGTFTCGGSILDKNHILTAAHCLSPDREPSEYSIQYGKIDRESEGNIIKGLAFKIHEYYSADRNFINDIAILKLSEDIKFGPNVQPVTLPNRSLNFELVDTITARLSGWGTTGTNTSAAKPLMTVELPIYDDCICEKYLSQPNRTQYQRFYQICAGGLDGTHKQCSGDSGGPLYALGAQHGIVSWSLKPCKKLNAPGVFTRVENYLYWIAETLQEL